MGEQKAKMFNKYFQIVLTEPHTCSRDIEVTEQFCRTSMFLTKREIEMALGYLRTGRTKGPYAVGNLFLNKTLSTSRSLKLIFKLILIKTKLPLKSQLSEVVLILK